MVELAACSGLSRSTVASYDVPTLMSDGRMAFQERRFALARKYFLLAHKQEPENVDAVNQYAWVDLAEGRDLGRARWMLEQALPAANPAKAPLLLDTLARIALREGRYADAQAALDQAEAIGPAVDPDFPTLLHETDKTLAQAPHSGSTR